MGVHHEQTPEQQAELKRKLEAKLAAAKARKVRSKDERDKRPPRKDRVKFPSYRDPWKRFPGSKPDVLGEKCTVCNHPERVRIDLLLLQRVSMEKLRITFWPDDETRPKSIWPLMNHRNEHLKALCEQAEVRQALEKSMINRLEWLANNAEEAVEDAKTAVKVVKTGPKKYERFRDLAPMAPAISAAKSVLELNAKVFKMIDNEAPAPTVLGVNITVPVSLGGQSPSNLTPETGANLAETAIPATFESVDKESG